MEKAGVEAIFRALNQVEARYLVAGGLAVLAHGYLRLTQEIDLILDFTPPHPEPALRAFAELDFRPLVPVALADFADPRARASWIREKHAQVIQLGSDRHPTVRIDLFLDPQFEFDDGFARAHRAAIADGVEVPFVALDDLFAMKRAAGRPQDLLDVENLERLRGLGPV